jgi:hypothetical protein
MEARYIGYGMDNKCFKIENHNLYYRSPSEKEYRLLKKDFEERPERVLHLKFRDLGAMEKFLRGM